MARRRRGVVTFGLALALMMSAGAAQAATPGTLDTSFGGGIVSPSGAGQFFGVAVQPNGAVVAVGQTSGGAALVQRVTGSGQADPSFGGSGQATGPGGVARAVALQPDGKIVVAGVSGGMFVERFNANGTRDASFGSGGVAHAFGSVGGIANGVAIAPDGKIVVVGSIFGTDTRIGVARFNANGTLDGSFGSGGTASLAVFNLPYESATAVAVQSDGKIVFTGYEQGSPNFGFYNGLVVRLTSAGGYDAGFNGNGVVSYHKQGGGGSGYDSLNAVAIQNDGKIVAAGSDVGGPYAVFLRFNTNGSFDTTFGNGGEAALSAGTFTSQPAGAYGVGIAGGGRIVGAGAVISNGTDRRAGVWATSAAGQPQSGFGINGVVQQITGAEACGFAVAPDGGLVVVGHHVSGTQTANPCSGSGGSAAFIARYVGYGPPPPPQPPASAPSATTGAATSVSLTSATLNGQVNPNGAATSYLFQYGTTTSYGSSTPAGSAGAARDTVPVAATLTGLVPGHTYHYRIEASNSLGTTTGGDATFTTPAPARATTGGATASEISARVTGSVDTGGLPTSYHVDYGKSAKYGSSTPAATLAATSSGVSVSALVRSLRPNTTYHYRLVAANSGGGSVGADRTFKTLPPLTAGVKGVASSYRLATVFKKGVSLKVKCNQACSVRGSLIISANLAKRLRLGRHQTSIGTRSGSLRRGGTVSLVVRLSATAKTALAHQRGVGVTLQVVIKPVGGGKSVTLKKSVTLTA